MLECGRSKTRTGSRPGLPVFVVEMGSRTHRLSGRVTLSTIELRLGVFLQRFQTFVQQRYNCFVLFYVLLAYTNE